MENLVNDDRNPSDDSRLAYAKPELIEAGKIADVTLANGNDGGDGGYS